MFYIKKGKYFDMFFSDNDCRERWSDYWYKKVDLVVNPWFILFSFGADGDIYDKFLDLLMTRCVTDAFSNNIKLFIDIDRCLFPEKYWKRLDKVKDALSC